MPQASPLANDPEPGDGSLGALLAARMMDVFVVDGNAPDNDLFYAIAESMAHRFEGAEDVGVIGADSFEPLVNALLMDQLRDGAPLPRLAGILPEYLLTRLPYWTPYAIWVAYLGTQQLKPLTLIDNDPVTAEHPELGPTAFYRVEFRVYPYLKALAP